MENRGARAEEEIKDYLRWIKRWNRDLSSDETLREYLAEVNARCPSCGDPPEECDCSPAQKSRWL